jgi:hypothetical protein
VSACGGRRHPPREYELTNHLGNVLATISDKKIGHDSSGVVDYYTAEVLSQNDYYPFGRVSKSISLVIRVNSILNFNKFQFAKNAWQL